MKFDSTYSAKNVLLSGTHTHSGPGGFLQYLLFDFTSFGFVRQTFDALVNGTVLVMTDQRKISVSDYINSSSLSDYY